MITCMDFNIHKVDRDVVHAMVKEEQIVRYSKEIQEMYTKEYYLQQKQVYYQPINIEMEIQKHILNKFGFASDKSSLEQYWKIPSTYWNDEEIKNSIFYMKLNIFEYPKVAINNDMIDSNLIDYQTGQEISLCSLQKPNRPLVILAGSMT